MSKSGKKNAKKPDEISSPEFENAGKYLRKLRTDKGLSTREVSEITRISNVNLNAIESQEFESLPADTFTRGFITIYADFLGADTPRIVARFMEERENSRSPGKKSRAKQSRKILAPKTLAEPSQVSSITMAGILLVVIIVLFTGFCLYTSWSPFSFLFKEKNDIHSMIQNAFPESKTLAEQPELSEPKRSVQGSTPGYVIETLPDVDPPADIQQIVHPGGSEAIREEGTSALQQDMDRQVQATTYLIHVTFLKDTRVKVAVDGQTTTNETFYPGDEKDWPADHSLHLVFDQPESATILLNGEPVVFPELKDGIATFQVPEEPGSLP